ncbi:hypothetical protein FA014_12520 [Cellulomonas hominis]|uniref:Uncharacterized protein n=1 Tax=Cellulomonas hominis TaxID=156981 RepID=A0A7Z8JZD1_9CELL|nr:hypothetical protein [Cellulomonas hominis]TKR23201.1 hypothetical protein FA014_12520 [Cellulomonas hominis]
MPKTRTVRSRLGLIATIGAIGVALGAWAGYQRADSAASSPHTDPIRTDSELLEEFGQAPLDAFELTPAETRVLADASSTLVATCMQAAGFDVLPPVVEMTASPYHWFDFLGVVDSDRAAAFGYQTTDIVEDAASSVETTTEAESDQDVAARDAALLGEGGCAQQARDSLNPSNAAEPESRSLNADLYAAAADSARRDPQVATGLRDWRSCMARAGYDLEEPPRPVYTSEPTPDEKRQALTDVSCKAEVGLVASYIGALYRAERRAVEQNYERLDNYHRGNLARVEVAREVLAGRPPA